MVDHTLVKVFSKNLNELISSFSETHNRYALGEVEFQIKYHTIDHILSLRAIIREDKAYKHKV